MPRPAQALPFLVMLGLVLASCGSPLSSNGSGSQPARFAATSCPYGAATGERSSSARCGYLVVPENRQIRNGKTIKLAVAIFKTSAPHPAPDPLVYLEGAPGSPLLSTLGPYVAANGIPDCVGKRDLILVDQRGAGLSQPSLACKPQDTVRTCHARLVKRGINLAAYSNVESAADIADLRTALGYPQVDLYGNSYGTTLALQVMRDHPQGIRAVVMDGITGPPFDVYNAYNAGIWYSVQRVFRDCAASPICNAEYPHLQQTFLTLLARLQAHPVKLRAYIQGRAATVTIRGLDVWTHLREILGDPTQVPQVPGLITSMAKGDYTAALQYAEAQASTPDSTSAGMQLSMNCSADQSRASRTSIAAHSQMVPASIRSAAIAAEVSALHACAIWHAPSIPAVNHTYFHSAIPTLLLPGEYDSKTPPSLAEALAPKLGHAYIYVMPSLSHGVVGYGSCPDSIASAFLATPNHRPDTSCATLATTPWQ